MKIFSSDIISEIDRATCEAQSIDSLELMERAASAVSYEIISRFFPTQRIVVIAGPGNNGGDALAAARMLLEQGFKRLEIYLFNVTGRLSYDCEQQRNKLIANQDVNFIEITKSFTPPTLGASDVVLDGLFGAGLKRPLEGGFKSLVHHINESRAYTISIDVPSGMFGEWNANANRRDMIHARLTLAISFPRIAFFFEEMADVVGEWELLDIELDQAKIRSTPTRFFFVEEKNVKRVLQPRGKFVNKRDCGSALIMAGSMGMMGAAVMCSRAAMRTGIGLVTVHSARCGMQILQSSVCEAMFEPDKNDRVISDMRLHHAHNAVGVGPGIGTYDDTVNALEGLLKNASAPLIIDADALNCIAKRPQLLSIIPPMSILTPHKGEFDRLFGEHESDEERLLKAIEQSQYYNLIIVLKGHYTAIVRPDGKVYFNSTGNPGMATAGSGDVLTGVITSLTAQGYKPETAAVVGAYIHGLAGDMAAQEKGQLGMTASDIIDNLPKALLKLNN
ncbi:MAG: NAD(P)H-hydrate dehydratase [Prevotella sp.]|nr:NAD(P)H-hydrate dehydratase [Prevotella sp.]MCM1075003.1 NAD(P)H-hydrate dehydratase [Ruminococcus sp.]